MANALAANIESKGSNAYYYAHTNSSEGLRSTLGEAPRLLSVGESASSSSTRPSSTVSAFSWCDDGDAVKVYIDVPGAASLADADVSLSFSSPRSFEVRVRMPSADLVFRRPKLFADIDEGASKVRRLRERVVVTLWKKSPILWYELDASTSTYDGE
jgi:CS domain